MPWSDGPEGTPRLMVFDTPAGGGIRMVDERVSRDGILARMDAEPIPAADRCELFRTTFRMRRDPWADAAWKRLADGQCVGERIKSSAAVAAAE
jgi:hypothetical protein